MSSRTRSSCRPLSRCRYVTRYCSASSPAAGSTTSSLEPTRKTTACSVASSSGWMPSSAGISGKTAAPSGTSGSLSSAMSAPCDGGNDADLVAVLDGGGEVVEVADVLVVEVDVDEAAQLAVVEQALADGGGGPPPGHS